MPFAEMGKTEGGKGFFFKLSGNGVRGKRNQFRDVWPT